MVNTQINKAKFYFLKSVLHESSFKGNLKLGRNSCAYVTLLEACLFQADFKKNSRPVRMLHHCPCSCQSQVRQTDSHTVGWAYVLPPQGEPEPFEETNVDRLMSSLGYGGGSTGTGHSSLGVKAHRGSDSSTLSSQPSINEVRTQMHMLLGNAFSLAPPDHDPPSPPTK